ncbi:unnamed protein product [Owenia fusiformis]|uniref:Sulfotransferase domain-containing protein n=1 Tax=Owenia fusiformis TaxID=6347 RepID=A0A8S4P905_OWEFU|nr:unnamed protein product [Owenia fusiformis]
MATPQEQFKPIKELLQVNKESQLGADANGDSFRCLKIDGAIYDPFFRCNLHKDADVFKVRDDDIWIVGYPRSGSHWLWEIVYLLVNKGVPPTNSIAKELFLWELNKKDYFDVISTEERRIFNSHMHSQFIPREVFTDTLGKIREIESFIMPDSNCNELRSLVKSLTSLDNMKDKNAAYGVNYKANADGNTIDKGMYIRAPECVKMIALNLSLEMLLSRDILRIVYPDDCQKS